MSQSQINWERKGIFIEVGTFNSFSCKHTQIFSTLEDKTENDYIER